MSDSNNNRAIGLVVNGPSDWYENLFSAFERYERTWLQQTGLINKKYLKIFQEIITKEGFFNIFGYVQKSNYSIEYLLKAVQILQHQEKLPPPDRTAPAFAQYDIDQGKCEHNKLAYKTYIKIISVEKIPPIPPSHFININTNRPLNHRHMKPPRFYASYEMGSIKAKIDTANRRNTNQIPYPSRSSFLQLCEEVIHQNKSKLLAGIVISVHLSEQGYNSESQITISSTDQKYFYTSWKGSDPTRFSARIGAAALALKNEKCFGTFRASHQSGLLTIHLPHVKGKLFKKVLKSQFSDGVRINIDFHSQFNPPSSNLFVSKGQSRSITVKFNNKEFDAKYLHENPSKVDRSMQSIRFSRELMEEFKAVFPTQEGYFSIKLGSTINEFLFEPITNDNIEASENFAKRFIRQEHTVHDYKTADKQRRDRLKRYDNKQRASTKKTSTCSVNQSDPVLKEDIKQLYRYKCQICSEQIRKMGWSKKLDPIQEFEYLTADAHHVIPLELNGLDTPSNIICVCPNCHRRLHTGELAIEFNADGPICRNQITDERLHMKIDSDHAFGKGI